MSSKGDVMVDFYFLRCDKVARENRGYCKVSQQLTATCAVLSVRIGIQATSIKIWLSKHYTYSKSSLWKWNAMHSGSANITQ